MVETNLALLIELHTGTQYLDTFCFTDPWHSQQHETSPLSIYLIINYGVLLLCQY